jgi:hypothetical protein
MCHRVGAGGEGVSMMNTNEQYKTKNKMADKKASLLLKGPIPVKPSTSSMVNYF